MDSKAFDELSQLCRIRCSEDEKEKIRGNLEKILSHMKSLESVNTSDVPPCYQVVHFPENVFDEDEVSDHFPIEDFLKNAPDQVGGMIKTPKVIQF